MNAIANLCVITRAVCGEDGAEAIKELLAMVNVEDLAVELRKRMKEESRSRRSSSFPSGSKLRPASSNPAIIRMDDSGCDSVIPLSCGHLYPSMADGLPLRTLTICTGALSIATTA